MAAAGFWLPLPGGDITDADDVRDAGRWEVLLDESDQPVSNDDGDWLYIWIEGT